MKKIFFLLLAVELFAFNINYINNAFSNSDYSKVCKEYVVDYAKKTNNDGLLNLYAQSCLKLDYINKLTPAINSLVKSKEARVNAVYYSTILYKKKLLYSALIDGLNIKDIKLPQCDYVLSDIYDNFVEGKYAKTEDMYIFNINGIKYELKLREEKPFIKMIVDIYDEDNNLKDSKEYW